MPLSEEIGGENIGLNESNGKKAAFRNKDVGFISNISLYCNSVVGKKTHLTSLSPIFSHLKNWKKIIPVMLLLGLA
jgi:hypothetical protein